MREIIGNNEDFARQVVSKKEALELFKNNPYKLELINELSSDSEISVYYLGNDFL